ncbi:molybdopterin synthase sulfur carrier subunit [Lutibacter oricola]|uniref:Molybdopterin synthase sulfur carrier subunit n=1 Tax=Lutibacter oricola TaxID=762486 RepID=A0A1H2S5S3_9FLAO|nr:MoaD/ThiS family protein [Lutibacter oricola]SDW26319.1 molybdopterin synthase sulfur carrier subunit [Lutibacter oricola]
MTHIQVLFFGITTDIVGENSTSLTVESNTSIKILKSKLIQKYPSLKNLNEFAIAVNEEYAENDLILKDNDVVAVIPPVSGG